MKIINEKTVRKSMFLHAYMHQRTEKMKHDLLSGFDHRINEYR